MTRPRALAATALTLALTLTGCAATGTPADKPAESTAQETAPAPTEAVAQETPTPAVPEGPAVGTVVGERPEDLPDGLGWFPLDDGTFLIVDSNAPLPQVVVDQVAATVPPASSDTGGQRSAASEAQGRIQRGTGKQAIVIYSMIGSKTADGPTETFYNLSGGAILPGATTDKAAAIAAAEAYIAAQADPTQWVIIDGSL